MNLKVKKKLVEVKKDLDKLYEPPLNPWKFKTPVFKI